MYVVRRAFKSLGKAYVAGDIIDDPATIKRFRSKLAEGKILEVTDANKEGLADYFASKFGVDILAKPNVNADDATNATEKPTPKPVKVVVAAAVK